MVTALRLSVLLNSFCAHTPQALLPHAPSAFHYLHCYHRQPWLASAGGRDLFLRVLEQVRLRFIVVVGYLAMPEHIHLLISEPEKADPSKVMQALK
jgi:putative transposase